MAKFEITKSIEAGKINPRSGLPTNEWVAIPFGAIIENPLQDGDREKFRYLGEPYYSKHPIAKRPIADQSAPPATPPAVPAPEPASAEAATITAQLCWEQLNSTYPARRAKVPGGWLVSAAGLAFYPDPEHRWDGTSLP